MSREIKLEFGYNLMNSINKEIEEHLEDCHYPSDFVEIIWNNDLQNVYVKSEFKGGFGYETTYYVGTYQQIRNRELDVSEWPTISMEEFIKSTPTKKFCITCRNEELIVEAKDEVDAVDIALATEPIKEIYEDVIKKNEIKDFFICDLYCREVE